MTTTTTKARRRRKPESNVEIHVRLSAKTKQHAEKLFKWYSLSANEGGRLIDSAVTVKHQWLAINGCRIFTMPRWSAH